MESKNGECHGRKNYDLDGWTKSLFIPWSVRANEGLLKTWLRVGKGLVP